ncbi:MAG TPA: hypothetical protein VFB43_19390 [Terracidiphilus sp.]|nr:hypothetical protein [Terracidiphilus sp.]
MKKFWIALMLVAIVPPVAAQAQAGEKKASKKMEAPAKETRWQGFIQHTDTEKMAFTVRGGRDLKGNFERSIFFDENTKWTKQGKPADRSEFKDGSFIIAIGTVDNEGKFHADRIDLRLPR